MEKKLDELIKIQKEIFQTLVQIGETLGEFTIQEFDYSILDEINSNIEQLSDDINNLNY